MHNLELNWQGTAQFPDLKFSLKSVDANIIYKKLAKSLHPTLNSTKIQGPPVSCLLRFWFNGAHNVYTQTMQTNTISNMCICVSNTYKDHTARIRSPLPLCVAKTGSNDLNEDFTPLLPTGIGERF